MTNLSDLLPAGAGGKTADFTANGSIASGKPVILETGGTVAQVGNTTVSASFPFGSVQSVSSTVAGEYLDVKADPNNNDRWIVAYKDDAGKDVMVRVYTLSGTTWTASPEKEVYNGTSQEMVGVSWLPNTEGKFIVCYDDQSSTQKAIVGTVMALRVAKVLL